MLTNLMPRTAAVAVAVRVIGVWVECRVGDRGGRPLEMSGDRFRRKSRAKAAMALCAMASVAIVAHAAPHRADRGRRVRRRHAAPRPDRPRPAAVGVRRLPRAVAAERWGSVVG